MDFKASCGSRCKPQFGLGLGFGKAFGSRCAVTGRARLLTEVYKTRAVRVRVRVRVKVRVSIRDTVQVCRVVRVRVQVCRSLATSP